MRRADVEKASEISDPSPIRKFAPDAQCFVDPNAKAKKMLPNGRMMRFQTQQAPIFHNLREGRWENVYRRSLAIETNATLIPVEEYEAIHVEIKETTGLFSKEGNLKKFLESRQAAGAYFRVIYSFMYMYTV